MELNENFVDENAKNLHFIISNSLEPLLFSKYLKAPILSWSLNDWERILKDETLAFRSGCNAFTKEPQWERLTKVIKGNFKDLVKFSECDTKNWYYFDYKYLKYWFRNIDEFNDLDLSLESLGMSNLTIDDCTIWIGTKGAHTPCHYDSYGCNLIFQIYGSKEWLVFPPESNLKPTRVPYEESSVYSRLNFFSPQADEFKDIKAKGRRIILNPGDILFLPHGWWHFVENITSIAISINIWIKIDEDHKERLNESIVQLLVGNYAKNLSQFQKDIILNPNSQDVLCDESENAVKLISHCKNIYLAHKNTIDSDTNQRKETKFRDKLDSIIDKYKFIRKIPELSDGELKDVLKSKMERFEAVFDNKCDDKVDLDFVNVINSITHPDVVDLIREKLCVD